MDWRTRTTSPQVGLKGHRRHFLFNLHSKVTSGPWTNRRIGQSTVEDHLPWLLDTFRPDLVLYDAGVDPHREDELGKLCLTDQGEPIIDVNLHSSISEFLVHPRAVSERSVRDTDCGGKRCSCCHGYRRGILQRHRQTGHQTLHRPQSSNTGEAHEDFIELEWLNLNLKKKNLCLGLEGAWLIKPLFTRRTASEDHNMFLNKESNRWSVWSFVYLYYIWLSEELTSTSNGLKLTDFLQLRRQMQQTWMQMFNKWIKRTHTHKVTKKRYQNRFGPHVYRMGWKPSLAQQVQLKSSKFQVSTIFRVIHWHQAAT